MKGPYAPRDYSSQPPALAPAYRSSIARSPNAPLLTLDHGIGEITSPTFGHGDISPGDSDLLTNFAQPNQSPIGERIILHGRVLDEDGHPIPETLVEMWQANAGGRYRHKNDTYFAAIDPNFAGCGRTLTDEDGYYAFRTIKPGAYPWPNGGNNWRPAHIHVSVFGRAFVQRLVTQCYFEGDPLITLCPIVQAIPDQTAINLLTAKLDMDATVPMDLIAYRFDIILRGRNAAVFETAQI